MTRPYSLPAGTTNVRSCRNRHWGVIEYLGCRRRDLVSRIHREIPPRRPMLDHIRRRNATKSKVNAAIEHVFGQQKDRMGLINRTVGIERAKAKVGLANIAYNMGRLIFHERRLATG